MDTSSRVALGLASLLLVVAVLSIAGHRGVVDRGVALPRTVKRAVS